MRMKKANNFQIQISLQLAGTIGAKKIVNKLEVSAFYKVRQH